MRAQVVGRVPLPGGALPSGVVVPIPSSSISIPVSNNDGVPRVPILARLRPRKKTRLVKISLGFLTADHQSPVTAFQLLIEFLLLKHDFSCKSGMGSATDLPNSNKGVKEPEKLSKTLI